MPVLMKTDIPRITRAYHPKLAIVIDPIRGLCAQGEDILGLVLVVACVQLVVTELVIEDY